MDRERAVSRVSAKKAFPTVYAEIPALAKISYLEWEMLDEEQQHQMYELVERFAKALQSSAQVNALIRVTMEEVSAGKPQTRPLSLFV